MGQQVRMTKNLPLNFKFQFFFPGGGAYESSGYGEGIILEEKILYIYILNLSATADYSAEYSAEYAGGGYGGYGEAAGGGYGEAGYGESGYAEYEYSAEVTEGGGYGGYDGADAGNVLSGYEEYQSQEVKYDGPAPKIDILEGPA